MNKDVIIACDFASAEETYRFLDKMGDVKPGSPTNLLIFGVQLHLYS